MDTDSKNQTPEQMDEPPHLPPLGDDFELPAQGCDLSGEGFCEACQ